ncbi:MAG: ATP-binding protein [Aestuariibacter sp.]
MFRLFISLYIFLVVALVGLSALLENIIFDNFSGEQETTQLAQALAQMQNPDSVAAFAMQADGQLAKLSPSAIALPQAQQQQLQAQRYFVTYSDDAKRHIYLLINEQLLHLTLAPNEPSEKFFWYSLSFFTILAGLIALWTYPLWRDIRVLEQATTKIKADGSLPKFHISPRSTVATIANALNVLSNQVKALLNNQRELTSAVAHEFRTPLARIKFSLESVTDIETKQSLQDDVLELEHLVQEMLEFSQSQHNKPELSLAEIDLEEMFESLLQRLPLHSKDIEIQQQCYCHHLTADGHFVERAVLNLLNNAVKYTHRQILLRCETSPSGQLISVEDDGEGVHDEDKQRIFEPFFRPDPSRNRRQGGAGLGLAIVNRIMSWHKGSCWVERSPLGGAKFVLCFPVGSATTPQEH